jgi:hypothetical protein
VVRPTFSNCGQVRVLYGSETWSLILREERRRRVFENRLLKRLFGPKRDEAMGGWRKQHKEEMYDLCSSPMQYELFSRGRRTGWARSANGGEEESVMVTGSKARRKDPTRKIKAKVRG